MTKEHRLLAAKRAADTAALKRQDSDADDKKYANRKNLTGLTPDWERFFEKNIKGKSFTGTYTAYIRQAIVEKLKQDGY